MSGSEEEADDPPDVDSDEDLSDNKEIHEEVRTQKDLLFCYALAYFKWFRIFGLSAFIFCCMYHDQYYRKRGKKRKPLLQD